MNSLPGCAGSQQASPGVLSTAPRPPAPVIVSEQTWTFAGRPGRIVSTLHYRLYTTASDPVLSARLPAFLEAALAHYRSALGPLREPDSRLDTFVMATRDQWGKLTQQLMGAQASVYLRIPRGGYASAGRAVYYDIGANDTMAIAAHEGWHQYTQRTFKDPLPVWLEEGVATYMEGHRWDGPSPRFLPWSNLERFDQLRTAVAAGTLLSLEDLLSATPQELIDPPAPDPRKPNQPRRAPDAALTYYAQLWALMHFLHEGEGGKYRPQFLQLLADASDGRLSTVLSQQLNPGIARSVLASRRGPALFTTYLSADLKPPAAEYARFVERLVRPGSRSPIVDGRSPIQQTE